MKNHTHFLKLLDFTPAEIQQFLDTAADLKAKKKAGIPHRYLEGKNVALIFEKTSTRTRCAFEVAAQDLGMGSTYLGPTGSQIGVKESIADTARALGRLYDGIEEMLDVMRERGIKTAVVTNKFDEGAQLLKAKLLPNVDCVVGTTDAIRPKPATDGVERALGIIGVNAADAVFVGDGETDIATARNAGLPVVAVTWGFRDREVLECLKPDCMIVSPDGLLPALEEEGLA